MLAEIDQRHVVSEDLVLPNGANAVLSRPDGPGPHPAVIVLHERDGIVRHTRELAIRFAADGYLALVPNLYFQLPEEMVTEHRIVISDEEVRHSLNVAIDYLTKLEGADTSHLAVMG